MLRPGLDVCHRRRAGEQQHPRSALPGAHKVGRRPRGLQGHHALNPLGETFLWRDLARHFRVIKMAMRVDQARQKNDFAEVQHRIPLVRRHFFPAADPGDSIAGDLHRAICNRRTGHRQHHAGTQKHERKIMRLVRNDRSIQRGCPSPARREERNDRRRRA
jgi:hypothetical protein